MRFTSAAGVAVGIAVLVLGRNGSRRGSNAGGQFRHSDRARSGGSGGCSVRARCEQRRTGDRGAGDGHRYEPGPVAGGTVLRVSRLQRDPDGRTRWPTCTRDTFAVGTDAPYKVGNGSGNINWRLNPYKNPSWYMWFHSLRWLGQGITAAGQGDKTALAPGDHDRARLGADNPYSWKANVGAWESTMHRTNVLICLRQAMLSGLQVTTLPAAYTWLDTGLLESRAFLRTTGAVPGTTAPTRASRCSASAARSAGPTTRSSPQTGSPPASTRRSTPRVRPTSSRRRTRSSTTRSGAARSTYCRTAASTPGTTISTRRALMAKWLALATNSLGNLHQIGDSEVVRRRPSPGTPLEYAGIARHGRDHAAQRVGFYSAGYVFGRTGWGTSRRAFTHESSYSIRFGPARKLHGHRTTRRSRTPRAAGTS